MNMEKKTVRLFLNLTNLYDFNSQVIQITESVLENLRICSKEISNKAIKFIPSFDSPNELVEAIDKCKEITEKEYVNKHIADAVSWSSKSVKPKLYTLLKLLSLRNCLITNRKDLSLELDFIKPKILTYFLSFNEDLSKVSKMLNLPVTTTNFFNFGNKYFKEGEISVVIDKDESVLAELYSKSIAKNLKEVPEIKEKEAEKTIKIPHIGEGLILCQSLEQVAQCLLEDESIFEHEFKKIQEEELIEKFNRADHLSRNFHFIQLWNSHIVLEKPITIENDVVHGFKRGSELLGIRTANIKVDEKTNEILKELICGVYFGYSTFITNGENKSLIGKRFKSALSIGYNPFFDNASRTIEVYLIDYEGNDFYNEILRLEIIGFLKTQANFEGGLKELVTSITHDIIISNELLS